MPPVAPPTWRSLITALVAGRDLTQAETEWAMDTIMSGEATEAQIAGFLVGLRAKGETVDELAGLVRGRSWTSWARAGTSRTP